MNRFSYSAKRVVFLALISLSLPFFAMAADFTVTPLIIDLKANPRDIIQKTIGVANMTDHVNNIYAFVNNTDPVLGTQEWKSPANTDVADSLANWIEINRSTLALEPSEKKELPLLIQVDLHAKPGNYHSIITFSQGGSRLEAEQNIKNGISVTINLEVQDDAKEVLELAGFTPSGTFIAGKEATFSYNIKNIGNRSLAPGGEVRIYNRSGAEVATLAVNKKGESLDPNGITNLASVWNSGSRFGRYKAMLNVEYGSKQRETLQDTVYFWLIPWKEILAVFTCLMIILLSFFVSWQNGYSVRKQRQLAYATPYDFDAAAPTIQNQVIPSERTYGTHQVNPAIMQQLKAPLPPKVEVVTPTPLPQPVVQKIVPPSVQNVEPLHITAKAKEANQEEILRKTRAYVVDLKRSPS